MNPILLPFLLAGFGDNFDAESGNGLRLGAFDFAERPRGCFNDDGNGKPAGGGKGDDKGDEGGDKKPVPYAEHRKVRLQLKAANEKIAEYEKKAPDSAKLLAERDAANARADNAEKDLQLRDLGVTDADDRAFIRERYNMTTKDAKDPQAFGDWLEAQQGKKWFQSMVPEATGNDGGNGSGNDAGKPRSDYADKKANGGNDAGKGNGGAGDGKGGNDAGKGNGGAGDGKGAGPAKKPAFNPNNGTRGDNGGDGKRPAFTREEIGAMSPDEYRANRDAIMTARREGRIE